MPPMPLEDELGEALRSAGAAFTPDPQALAAAGERRGRRLVARRRAAVAGGSVLALALIGTAGAWTGGLIGGDGGREVASAPPLPGRGTVRPPADGPQERAGTGAVTAQQMTDILKSLLPAGQFTQSESRGSDDQGPMATGIFDDGKGQARIGILLTRIDPAGAMAKEMTTCPERKNVAFDSCEEEKLPDGSRLLLIQSYDYDDSRKSVKDWRATLATPQGYLLDASEYNAPQSKQARPTRAEPPLAMDRMKALVLSEKWRPALEDLPPAPSENSPAKGPEEDAEMFLATLLRGYEIPVADRGGDGGYGYVVLDDGKGRSLVELRVQQVKDSTGFPADATAQADGVRAKVTQGPAGENAPGVVRWTVDTLRPGGMRITVSAYNAPKQTGPASRSAPALTVEQVKEVALNRHWKDVDEH
ncbi:hypothetical protein Slala02_40280 [Streptomyces lavendulae subsp. lavendulae]|nr:hypothetical protein Slala01_42740 [Streptomyces lavendulae subsp. lavendulae]GLX28208.1 hypothetical protein Slala02_40280 [Streptomyces lavendulae subsp. lavendulae]